MLAKILGVIAALAIIAAAILGVLFGLKSCAPVIEGSSQIGIRIGTDNPEGKFNETIYQIPVGESSLVSVTTKLQSNKQDKSKCRLVVSIDGSAEIVKVLQTYSTGCVKDSEKIPDDKKSIEYLSEVSQNTKDITVKIIFEFTPKDIGKCKISLSVYRDGTNEEIISACQEKSIEFI